MSVFKISMGLCNEIQQSIAGFWWSKRNEKSGIFWTKWESMSQAKSRGGMGFRDISSFNQALVAKQGWRLIQNPKSLAARIMKARYFRKGNFFTASTSSNPSYIWRSLLWGRQVILKGYRWRIGNGMSVLIYRENWIQRPSTFQPFSTPKMFPEAKVAELIVKENRWKSEVIQHNFLKDDVEEILRISLPRREMEDKVIWHYDKQGRFSVKSGYQVALKLKFSDPPSCSDSRGNNWGVIWKLNIPEKIKIFAWKAAKNILPTVENLWKRKIIQEALCKRCGEGMENTWHALISCKAANKVWHSSALASAFQDMRSSDLLGELMRIQKMLSRADIEMLVTTFWVIWYA